MTEDNSEEDGIVERITKIGEETVLGAGKAMLGNPMFKQALSTTMGATERAAALQRQAMEILNVSSIDDVKILERRMRSISQRLDDLEDQLDELSRSLAAQAAAAKKAAAETEPT